MSMRAKTSIPTRLLPCELYQAWEAARDEANMALHDWYSAPIEAKRDAYVVYRAAVDREDAAAGWFMRSGTE